MNFQQTVMNYNNQLVQSHKDYQAQQGKLHLQFLQQREMALKEMTAALLNKPPLAWDKNSSPQIENVVNRIKEMSTVNDLTESKESFKSTESSEPLHPFQPVGPSLSRSELEVLTSGKISDIFGDLFKSQDKYAHQSRMPKPPLLFADRVLGMEGEPGSLGLGKIWFETDVSEDSWYLYDGCMPAGLMLESVVNASPLLMSWLGINTHNKGERFVRFLGCKFMFHESLVKQNTTITSELTVDAQARNGDMWVTLHHIDSYVAGQKRLTLRNAKVGFFTKAELLEARGVNWDVENARINSNARRDAPVAVCEHRSFNKEQVSLFAQGHTAECFGNGYEKALTHTRSPRVQSGDMLMIDEVGCFDPQGGPWGGGYIKARKALQPNEWFFLCHFYNDPVMPGMLQLEGCLQAMAFYLAGLGFTLDKDGYRFEPIPEVMYEVEFRGQALPTAREVIYEVFVEEVHGGEEPKLYADLLVTVDGLKVCCSRRMGLRLVKIEGEREE
jgi:3-hydroxymyristoyl/3-hydroxydecanoyl-(acyl carrier protein) dehydratase